MGTGQRRSDRYSSVLSLLALLPWTRRRTLFKSVDIHAGFLAELLDPD
jgi:hypothetical protein